MTMLNEQTPQSRLERGKQALAEIDGQAGQNVIDALAGIAPDFATYLLEFPFGDIYSRPGLSLRDREIATIAALAAMGTAQPQLHERRDHGRHNAQANLREPDLGPRVTDGDVAGTDDSSPTSQSRSLNDRHDGAWAVRHGVKKRSHLAS